MGAQLFSVDPRPTRDVSRASRANMPARLRQVHRWMSIVFSLTVAANFAALTRGPVPALITYSPLPPLLVLTLTGAYMFARHVRGKPRPAMLQSEG